MTTLSSVKQELSTIRHKKGNRLLSDAEIFEQSGFYSVPLGFGNFFNANWPDIHQWCQEQFGKDHYTWTGSTFWFENERDAVMFALRWR